MGKVKITAEVVSQTCIATDIYSLILKAGEIASQAVAGQFVSVYSKDGSRMLPRPISLCGIDKEAGTLRLVYRIAGKGFMKESGKAILIGGGIGIPPMLQLAKELDCEKSIVLGYRDELFLNEEFEPYGSVYLSSEDGMHGTKGNVIDAIKACAVTGDIIYACGPTPMLRGIKQYAAEQNIRSLEEKMACGVGACLACVCQTKNVDEHSKVHNARICADGPVFYAEEVEL